MKATRDAGKPGILHLELLGEGHHVKCSLGVGPLISASPNLRTLSIDVIYLAREAVPFLKTLSTLYLCDQSGYFTKQWPITKEVLAGLDKLCYLYIPPEHKALVEAQLPRFVRRFELRTLL
ncbi:hypothetical protein HDV00_009629 [Rhizophlyctis rosea]|nr:hypothetical protein HDV00_009629 [Rhizophlyctis rosea]